MITDYLHSIQRPDSRAVVLANNNNTFQNILRVLLHPNYNHIYNQPNLNFDEILLLFLFQMFKTMLTSNIVITSLNILMIRHRIYSYRRIENIKQCCRNWVQGSVPQAKLLSTFQLLLPHDEFTNFAIITRSLNSGTMLTSSYHCTIIRIHD